MKDEIIKQIFIENLKHPDNEDFNNQIIQKLNIKRKKQSRVLFDERSIVYWFLLISAFVLFFNLSQESKPDTSVILIGIVICLIPLSLMIFNKIYLLKNS